MDFTIKRMEASDLEAVKSIEVECSLSPWSIEDYRQEIDREGAIALVAEQAGKVIGFITARLITHFDSEPEEIEIEINNLGIADAFRRKSVGSVLVESVIERCGAKTVIVYLEVRRHNRGAIEFYLNQQFREVGTRKNFYSEPVEDAIVMRRYTVNP